MQVLHYGARVLSYGLGTQGSDPTQRAVWYVPTCEHELTTYCGDPACDVCVPLVHPYGRIQRYEVTT